MMITDFDWLLPADLATHPASLYYLPIVSPNARERDQAVGRFCSAMMHTDPMSGNGGWIATSELCRQLSLEPGAHLCPQPSPRSRSQPH